jgi:hypothetical protein
MESVIHEEYGGEDREDGEIAPPELPDPEVDGWTIHNEWYSQRLGRTVAIITNGVRVKSLVMGAHDYVQRLELAIRTGLAAEAWTSETETTATSRLAELIKPHLWHSYMTTGAFPEVSERSGVLYFFRRCRPTVAIKVDQHGSRILCALCLHPIGFYQGTHAGSMCPTDDVIAHLLMMRADEPLFWRRANQHAPWKPESGI